MYVIFNKPLISAGNNGDHERSDKIIVIPERYLVSIEITDDLKAATWLFWNDTTRMSLNVVSDRDSTATADCFEAIGPALAEFTQARQPATEAEKNALN